MDWVEALVTQSINTQLPAAQHQSLNIGRINVSLSVLDMGRNISIITNTSYWEDNSGLGGIWFIFVIY